MNLLAELISCDTQNPGAEYAEISKLLVKELKKRGATVCRIKKSIYAYWGKPKLLLNAHMDTVTNQSTNQLKIKIKGKRIYGLGTCDTKGNIYCILKALEQKPKNLAALFSSDEEYGKTPGTLDFLATNYANSIHKALVFEPTENKVVTSHPGYYAFAITFKARSGHSSVKKHPNALELAALTTTKLMKKFGNKFSLGSVKSESVMANVNALTCTIIISIRTFSSFAQVQNIIAGYCGKNAKITVMQNGPAFLNKKPFLNGANASYWTEAGLLAKAGINCVVYGAGSIKQAHKPDEYVEGQSLEKCIKFVKKIVGEQE